jgi:hypothetical protein
MRLRRVGADHLVVAADGSLTRGEAKYIVNQIIVDLK